MNTNGISACRKDVERVPSLRLASPTLSRPHLVPSLIYRKTCSKVSYRACLSFAPPFFLFLFPRATRVALVDIDQYCELVLCKAIAQRRYRGWNTMVFAVAVGAAASSWPAVDRVLEDRT